MTKKSKQSSQLEQEFTALVDTIGEEIQAKVAQAASLLREAAQLADQHGIPFYSNFSELGQSYVPESFAQKFSKLERQFVTELTEVMPDDLERAYGWSTSEVC